MTAPSAGWVGFGAAVNVPRGAAEPALRSYLARDLRHRRGYELARRYGESLPAPTEPAAITANVASCIARVRSPGKIAAILFECTGQPDAPYRATTHPRCRELCWIMIAPLC